MFAAGVLLQFPASLPRAPGALTSRVARQPDETKR